MSDKPVIPITDQVAEVGREIGVRRQPPALFELKPGVWAKLDAQDAWIFTFWRWNLRRGTSTSYLSRRHNRKIVHLHRQVIGAPRGVLVDHINGDGLDNRRCNLRLATHAENMRNRAFYRDQKTGFFGVSFHPASGLYRARVNKDGREHTTYHETVELAARGRDELAKKHFGEFACLNFPGPDPGEVGVARMEAAYATLKWIARHEQRIKQLAPDLAKD